MKTILITTLLLLSTQAWGETLKASIIQNIVLKDEWIFTWHAPKAGYDFDTLDEFCTRFGIVFDPYRDPLVVLLDGLNEKGWRANPPPGQKEPCVYYQKEPIGVTCYFRRQSKGIYFSLQKEIN